MACSGVFGRVDASSLRSDFSKNLRIRMIDKDMCPEMLSVQSGVCIDSIRKYIRGEAGPLLESAWRLAQVLGCTVNDLCAPRG